MSAVVQPMPLTPVGDVKLMKPLIGPAPEMFALVVVEVGPDLDAGRRVGLPAAKPIERTVAIEGQGGLHG
jgi:hypothetical protein